jgi:hypothetical protein
MLQNYVKCVNFLYMTWNSVLYRLPNAVAESISEIGEVVRLVGKNGLFIGDFNLQDIDWERGVVRRAVTLLEVAEDNMMKQLVSF